MLLIKVTQAHHKKQDAICSPNHPFTALRLLRRCKSDFYPFQTEQEQETGNSTQRALPPFSAAPLSASSSPPPPSSPLVESPPTPPFFLRPKTGRDSRRKARERERGFVFIGLRLQSLIGIFLQKTTCCVLGAAVTHRSPADGTL